MTLLLRDPDVQPEEPTAVAPPEAPVEVRACPRCQTPLEADQDWCLACGEAQPGRLGGRPGIRAVATVLALTGVLAVSAVAASYAALRDDPAPKVTGQVAQVQQPADAVTPSAAVPAAPSAAVPAAPAATPPAAPDPGATPAPAATAQPPAATPDPTPAVSTPKPSSSTSTSTTKTDTSADTRTTTTPVVAPPKAIALESADVALYDPYSRASGSGDPAKAVDGDPGTSFPVVVAPGSDQIGAGLVADLGKTRGIREIDLTAKTPGFRVEIYATDSDELPPDVLDTRWAHLKDVSNVGSAGKQTISLGSGATKYRHLLLWFTTPPKDGSTVRVAELKVLG